eukprot:5367147-Prymnesium_polylepis.1
MSVLISPSCGHCCSTTTGRGSRGLASWRSAYSDRAATLRREGEARAPPVRQLWSDLACSRVRHTESPDKSQFRIFALRRVQPPLFKAKALAFSEASERHQSAFASSEASERQTAFRK